MRISDCDKKIVELRNHDKALNFKASKAFNDLIQKTKPILVCMKRAIKLIIARSFCWRQIFCKHKRTTDMTTSRKS